MKVHLIRKQTIESYIANNAQSRSPFASWLSAIKMADWHCPDDIQQEFGSADLLGNGTNRVVFNIGGNNYRMICQYLFGMKNVHLFICWLGTHAEYSKLCRLREQYTINQY